METFTMTQLVNTSFNFRTKTLKDAEGNAVGERKLPTLTVAIPSYSTEEIIIALSEAGTVQDFILGLVNQAVVAATRAQISEYEQENPACAEIPVSCINLDLLTLTELASSGSSNSNAISDEDLAAFFADYEGVMPEVTGKSEQTIKKHTSIFKSKFSSVKNDKGVLALLLENLLGWKKSTENFGDHSAVFNMLQAKATGYLNKEAKPLLELL